MITDNIVIKSGYIINFGIIFDVTSHRSVNKQEVKLRCINTIREYFNIKNMLFKQPIIMKDLEYELMTVEGVSSVINIIITQDNNSDYFAETLVGSSGIPGSENESIGNYGWSYGFASALSQDMSFIKPSIEPAVFELKNSTKNIKGTVR